MTEVVIVPAEPTPEMVEAGWRAKGGSHEGRPVWKCTVDVQVALIYLAMLAARPAAPTQSAAQTGEACRCSRCVNEAVAAEGGSGFDTRLMQMFLCTQCGNKRCPHATDHRLSCTNSNEAGQEGSSYGPPLYRRDQATLIEAQAAEIEGLRKVCGRLVELVGIAFYDGFKDAIERDKWDDCYDYAAAKGGDYAKKSVENLTTASAIETTPSSPPVDP